MRLFFLMLLFLCHLICNAQDTLTLKNGSRILATVLHTTEEDVVYKKFNDKKERGHIIAISKLKYISYANGTKSNLDSLYIVSHPQLNSNLPDSNIIPKRKHDLKMYKKGIEDASWYYTFDEFIASRSMNAPVGNVEFVAFRQKDINFPDQSLSKYADYRAGYIYKVQKLRTKYRLIILGTFLGVGITAVFVFNVLT